MPVHKQRKTASLPQCPLCKCTYISEENLKQHQENCDGPRRCKICNEKFPSKSKLEHHYETCHKQLNCKVCGYRCLTKNMLKEHVVKEHEWQEKFPCSKFKDVFYSQNALLSHVAERHQDLFATKK